MFFACASSCLGVSSARSEKLISLASPLTSEHRWGHFRCGHFKLRHYRNYRYFVSWGPKCIRKISCTKEKQFCRDYFPQLEPRYVSYHTLACVTTGEPSR